jgi:hypothetical protein
MSLAQRFERRLEGMVGSAFARVFKGQVEPVEIGQALQREATDKKAVMGNGEVLAPNRYRVTLSASDFERLAAWEAQLTKSLAELVQEYLDDNRLATIGDIEVYLAEDASLHTGVFGVASRMEPKAAPRRRPYESMSMPVVADNPDEYLQPFDAPAPGLDQLLLPPTKVERPVPAPVEPIRPAPFRAQLFVDGTPESLDLRPGSNIVGRGQEADLQLLDQGVSRRHLDVQVSDGQAIACDLGSTNGTSINGHSVQSQRLQHGDVLRVGHSRLVYQQDPA